MTDKPLAGGELPPEDNVAQGPPLIASELDGLDDWVFISRGGHGEVWAATERSLGRRVAVKILPQLLGSAARHRFRVESSAIGSLTGHPSILSVHRSGITADGHGVIVMEHAERSLADQLASDGPLPPDQVTSIITKIAAGLDAAHESGVLHLDVKPANVLISAFGEPKLADFGVAAISSPPMDATIDDPGEWIFGMTPGYGPPELLEGDEPSVSTDVHLLAATAVALLSGHPPYARTGDSPLDVWRRTLTSEPDFGELGVPEDMIPALAAGLARDPSRRPTSAGDFARLLAGEVIADGGNSVLPEGRPADQGSNYPARRRVVLLGAAAAVLLLVGAIFLTILDRNMESEGAASGADESSDLWVDTGLWGGVGLIDVERQELLTLLPGQEGSRPLNGTNGVWMIEVGRSDDRPPVVRMLDPATGSTLDSFEFPDQDTRSTCQLVAGDAVSATCQSDATRRPDDPVDRVTNPTVTLYRLSDAGAEPALARDGRLSASSASGTTVWMVIDEDEPLPEVGALVVRVDADASTSTRLPAGSQAPVKVAATDDGLWLVDGRVANLMILDGSELTLSSPQTWNLSPDEVSGLDLSEAVEYEGGIAFVALVRPDKTILAVHLRVDAEPVTAKVPFRYQSPGLFPVLAVTPSGKWWTLGDVGIRGEFTLVEIGFPTATLAAEIPFRGRLGPFSDPSLQAVGDDLVVMAELPASDISAVIVDGSTGRTRATIPLQQRSLLPLVGADDQVVVADLWTASMWIVEGVDARSTPGSNISDPPVAIPDGFAVTSRQRGGGGLHAWNGDLRGSITVDGELFSDAATLWYENFDATGVVDTRSGQATPITAGNGTVSMFSGTRGLIRNAAVIGGDFWRIGDGVVERSRPDGTVSTVAISSPPGPWAIARSPTGSVAAMVGGEIHMIDPTTGQVVSTATVFESAPTGYLVSDDMSLWWVALYDGSAARLDPATGAVLDRVDDLGEGVATAAVSSGALVVAHENSATLTRVGADGERLTREVGPRPYWVSANDDLVVVGLQGERAVAEFDTVDLTERRRIPLGPSGPDS